MSSKWALFCVLLCFLCGCAKENQPASQPVEVQLKNGGECLRKFGTEISRFFDGRMSQQEVATFWNCSAEAIREFQRLTSGENGGDTYTPQAIRRFLYKHKFLEQPLTDELMVAVMDLKAVFLAGTTQSVTREELSRLQDLLMEIKGAALDLNPHLDLVFHRREGTDAEIRAAGTALERSALRLAVWLDRHKKPYTLTQLADFVAALKVWIQPGSDSQNRLTQLEKAITALRPAKKLLVGGSDNVISGTSWLPLWTGIGHVMVVYLDLRHIFGSDLNSGLMRDLLPEVAGVISQIIAESIQYQPDRRLPAEDFHKLFKKLGEADLLVEPLTEANLTQTFDWLIARGLGEGSADAVTSVSARKLREISDRWLDLNARLKGEFRKTPATWDKFNQVLQRSVPLEWDQEGRLRHPRQGVTTWTLDNARRMVWPFVILDWVRESYVGSRETLTEDDLMLAVSEILPLLQSFGWLKETKLTIGRRLLREADLFTLASDGNFALDLAEATRYLAFVASGLRTAEIWLEEAKAQCPGLMAECVRQSALAKGAKALEPFPELKKRVNSEPPESFLQYMRQAEETILDRPVKGAYGTRDLLQVLQLFQYVETFLRIFDADHTETIELPESLVAYQTYGPTLSRLLSKNGLPPEEVLAFFTFMMKYGDTPFTKFGGQIYFNHWKWHRNDWAFSADRTTLMSILNQLSKL